MTATRSITWGIPSTTSRTASRIIIRATFTGKRNPGTVSRSLLRLRDFRARMTTASGMLGGLPVASFYPISTVTSAKIATGEKKIAFPQRLPANAPSRACESERMRVPCVYVCMCASTLSSVETTFSRLET